MSINALSSTAVLSYSQMSLSIRSTSGSAATAGSSALASDSVSLSAESLEMSALMGSEAGPADLLGEMASDPQMLEMLIALVLLSCLAGDSEGANTAMDMLSQLFGGSQNAEASSTSMSLEYTSISMSMESASLGSMIDIAA